MKKYTLIFFLFVLFSCKSQTSLISEVSVIKEASVDSIIHNHFEKNKIEFSTLSIKANAKYKDEKQSQNVTADIKILKDQKILVSIRFLGFTMAKALITPTSVQYYEKLGSKFFEGDFVTLSNWLGTNLDFFKIQNLILGKPLNDLTKDIFLVTIVNNLYKLESTIDKSNSQNYFFESGNYTLKNQNFFQPDLKRSLDIYYPNYQKVNEFGLPLSLEIDAKVDDKINTINLEYRSVTFNEDITFSYSVPDGYEKIYIK